MYLANWLTVLQINTETHSEHTISFSPNPTSHGDRVGHLVLRILPSRQL